MEYVSYNSELSYSLLMVKRLFNNITIYRDKKPIKVTCVVGNRTRIFKNMENPSKKGMYKLPMIIIQRTGITKNPERISNLNNEVKYRTSSKNGLDYNLYAPVPIDVTYSITVVSKYQEDIDMCMSNFIPFFNKDLFVQCEHPKFEGVVFQSQVVMEDSISEEHPDELDATQDDLIEGIFTFTHKTYIFGGNKKAKGSYIERIISTYVSTYYDPDISSEISTEISTDIDIHYDGFIPDIRHIYFGLYPVPLLSAYIPHINWVDSLSSQGIEEWPYVDRFHWYIDETSVSYYDTSKMEDSVSVISSLKQEGNQWEYMSSWIEDESLVET